MGAKGKKAAKGGSAPGPRDGRIDFSGEMSTLEKRLTSLLRPVAPPPPKSEAEKARLRARMIQYGKLKRAQHLEIETRMNNFLRAKWAAVDALPNYRRVEVFETEAPELPNNKPIFTDTPPIKGFKPGEITKPS